jgi:uncharacterized protein (TIGR03435 family)
MNAIDRLGWSLLYFLWQGTIIAVLYAAARRAARFAGPNARYLLACGALAAMAAAPIATWMILQPAAGLPVPPDHSVVSASGVATGVFASTIGAIPLAPKARFLPWVVALWFAGAIAFSIRLAGGWLLASRLRTVHARPAPAEWQQTLDRLKLRLRVARPVRLLVSALVSAPTVVGWLRPVVLMPLAALTGLPPDQVEALLIHELAHIRRADYLVNLLQGMIEALLFYHPAVWWISRHIRAEREMCCDDAAVAVCGDVLMYAQALAELEAARSAHFRAALAANGGTLTGRIARLLGASRPASRRSPGPGIAAAAVIAVAALALFAQPAARPKFEVASVKPAMDQGFQRVRPLPGGLSANASVSLLMQNAYALQPFQIVNAPVWTNSERYAIDAKADGAASRERLFLMLQALLEDRFQLKTHHETRELPVYSLVAARGGVKLPAPKEGSCVNGEALPTWQGGRIPPPGQAPRSAPVCGGVMVMLEPSGARFVGGKVPMSELVRMLTLVLGRMVVDKTGHTEPFDLSLDFLPDAASPALPPPPPGAAVWLESASIVTALQEQLGLKLESARGPVDVLVIDHVERPSAN